MIYTYINSPAARGAYHRVATCAEIRKHGKEHQRRLQFDAATFAVALNALDDMPFRAEAGFNDVWLEIDFNDQAFELAVAEFVVRRLAGRYSRIARIKLTQHC